MSTSTSALKARHYNALANSLRQLQNGLSGSEEQMDRLAEHLGSMQKLGTHSAAQYVPSYLLTSPLLPSSLLIILPISSWSTGYVMSQNRS